MMWNLINSPECPAVISGVIDDASERAVISAMRMVYDSTTGPILDMLLDHAEYSPHLAANSLVLPDAYSFYNPEISGQEKDAEELRRYLYCARSVGMTAYVANEINPVIPPRFRHLASQFGRDHKKIYIGDDEMLGFGGCNFTGPSFSKYLDFLLHSQNEEVTDFVYDLAASKIKDPSKEDIAAKVDKDWVLVDSGRFGASIIQDTAEELLQSSQEGTVTFTSLYRPFPKLEKLLEDVGALCVYNDAAKLTGTMATVERMRHTSEKRHQTRNVHNPRTLMHAKLLLMTLKPDIDRPVFPEGGRVGIFGTNNLNSLGKYAETQEYALITKDEQVIDQAEKWVNDVALAS